MYSTAADLRTFAEALFGGRLLEPQTLQRLMQPGLDAYGFGAWRLPDIIVETIRTASVASMRRRSFS